MQVVQVVLGRGLYTVAATVWLAVLSGWDVSKAYPLVGTGFALTALVGYSLGGEASDAHEAGRCGLRLCRRGGGQILR